MVRYRNDRYRYFGQYLLSRNSAKRSKLRTNIMLNAHFNINIDINFLVASVLNLRSISIICGLSFEFESNINILEASVSKRYRYNINILAIFPISISISTSKNIAQVCSITKIPYQQLTRIQFFNFWRMNPGLRERSST